MALARSTLITGALGVGKTTTIRKLIAQRPAAERWAVIVNEFGAVGIDGTTLTASARSGVEIREVAGGCICCAANVPLRVAIVEVLRRVRPDRLLIEPTGLAHPSAILATLAAPGLSKAVQPGLVLCVVDARHRLPGEDGRDPFDATWCDQVSMADIVIVNKRDLVDDQRYFDFTHWVRSMYPPKQAIMPAIDGDIPVSLLDTPRVPWRPWLDGGHDAATVLQETPILVPGLGTRHVARSGSILSVGWVIEERGEESAAMYADQLDRLLIGLSTVVSSCGFRLLRAKGALRTDQGTRLIEWAADQVRDAPLSFSGPGRFELLLSASPATAATGLAEIIQAIEQSLQTTRSPGRYR